MAARDLEPTAAGDARWASDRDVTARFRCSCGRSVAAPLTSPSAVTRTCSRCRRRRSPDDELRRD